MPCCCWVALWSKSRELVRVGAEPGGRVGRRSKPAPSLALSSGLCCLGPHRQLHGHSAALQSTVHSRAPALPAPRFAPPPPSARASEPTHLGREAGYRFGRPAQCISVVHLAAPSRQHGPSQAPSLSGNLARAPLSSSRSRRKKQEREAVHLRIPLERNPVADLDLARAGLLLGRRRTRRRAVAGEDGVARRRRLREARALALGLGLLVLLDLLDDRRQLVGREVLRARERERTGGSAQALPQMCLPRRSRGEARTRGRESETHPHAAEPIHDRQVDVCCAGRDNLEEGLDGELDRLVGREVGRVLLLEELAHRLGRAPDRVRLRGRKEGRARVSSCGSLGAMRGGRRKKARAFEQKKQSRRTFHAEKMPLGSVR